MRNTFLQTVATWPAIRGRFMPFSTLGLFVVTAGMATLGFAIAAPASAQEHYGQKHMRTPITRMPTIAITPAMTRVVRSSFMRRSRAGAERGARRGRGQRRAGTGQAVQSVFVGAGGFVGGVLGESLAAYRRSSAAPATLSLQRPATAARSLRRSMRPAQSPRRPSRWSAALLEGRRHPALPMHRRRARPRTPTRALVKKAAEAALSLAPAGDGHSFSDPDHQPRSQEPRPTKQLPLGRAVHALASSSCNRTRSAPRSRSRETSTLSLLLRRPRRGRRVFLPRSRDTPAPRAAS